jgi:molecular chaperone GrpE
MNEVNEKNPHEAQVPFDTCLNEPTRPEPVVDEPETSGEEQARSPEEPDMAEKLAEINDKYLRLVAEFDNFRKRTARERLDTLLIAGENVISGLLPVIDDFERAQEAMQLTETDDSVKEGVRLIYEKLVAYLQSKGLQRIDAKGQDLDTDLHEAVGKMPAAGDEGRGKIGEVVQNGYTLNGKVIRYAKVIIGE